MAKSIKQFPFRATKKGKTKGRPSKAEYLASALTSYFMEFPEAKAEINKIVFQMLMFGGYSKPSQFFGQSMIDKYYVRNRK